MKQFAVLKKENLDAFISSLAQTQKVVAPVSLGYKNFSFQNVTSAKDIAIRYIPTILPPKKYFLPTGETLAAYDKGKNSLNAVLEYEKMVIFGVHTCDLAGIQCLNMVFSDKPKDINYIVRKNKIAIIGLECNEYCDEYASCHVVNNHLPNGGYDLFFTDLGDTFVVHINTMLGDELVDKAGVLKAADDQTLKSLELLRAKNRKFLKTKLMFATPLLSSFLTAMRFIVKSGMSWISDVWLAGIAPMSVRLVIVLILLMSLILI